MSKFKVGNRVKGVNGDIDGCEGIITEVKTDRYIIRLEKVGNREWQWVGEWQVGNEINRPTFWEDCLELIEENNMKYKQGDVLVDTDGSEKKILGVCGEVYFIGWDDNFDYSNGPYTQKELDNRGYTLKTEPEITELTVAEIEKKLGVKNLKVVKEAE